MNNIIYSFFARESIKNDKNFCNCLLQRRLSKKISMIEQAIRKN